MEVYLYRHSAAPKLSGAEIIERADLLKNNKISYSEYLSHDSLNEFIDKGITDHNGYVKFDALCDYNDKNTREDYYVLALLEDPQKDIEMLYAAYDSIQKELSSIFQKIWEIEKPKWKDIVFVEKIQKKPWQISKGIATGVMEYASGAIALSPAFYYKKNLATLFKKILDTLYSPQKFEEG